MTEDQLLGPHAWGEPCGSAVFKAATEDFQVREQLHIPFSGNGEHLWLLIEKRALGTEDVARMLARAAGVALSEVSYAGLKDRQAVTSQWFSVRLPGRTDPDLSALWSDNLRCLQQTRHSRKLQRGAHNANRFLIRLHELQADRDALQQRLETLAAEGVPNYFGPQRFGIHGNNVDQARQWATRGGLPPARGTRSRLLSAARSLLFNQYLAQRVAAGSWNRVLDGDRLAFSDSRSHFAAADLAADDPRLAALDLHPTGPCGGRVRRQVPASSCSRNCSWPGTSRSSVTGWKPPGWSSSGVFCDSPLVSWRGIIRRQPVFNLNSPCPVAVLPPLWCASWSV